MAYGDMHPNNVIGTANDRKTRMSELNIAPTLIAANADAAPRSTTLVNSKKNTQLKPAMDTSQ